MNSSNPVIEITRLTKRFGKTEVLRGVDLRVTPGQTFAFLGINGAGKSTTIHSMMGLVRPDGGAVRVLGLDPAKDALEVRRRVGYLAEDQQMFRWMTVQQTMRFVSAFYPNWNASHAEQLARSFALPLKTKVRHLSKGQNVRLGLLLALAHQPQLVILDDPTLGLDPIMRKQLLREVVAHLQGTSTTVFFSSHLLYEIEPIADAVAILHHGRVIKSAATEDLRQQVKRLVFPRTSNIPGAGVPGILDVQVSGRQVAVVTESADEAIHLATAAGIPPEVIDLNLDEIFEAYVIGTKEFPDVAAVDLETVA